MNGDAVRKDLDMTKAKWNTYIADRIISKQSNDGYDSIFVANEMLRHKDKLIQSAKAHKTNAARQLDKAKLKIAELDYQLNGGSDSVKLDKDGNVIETSEKKGERYDLILKELKIDRMKHEALVRMRKYMPVEGMFDMLEDVAKQFAASLDPIAIRIKQHLPDMTSRAYDELQKILSKSRNDLDEHINGQTVARFVRRFDPEADLSSYITDSES